MHFGHLVALLYVLWDSLSNMITVPFVIREKKGVSFEIFRFHQFQFAFSILWKVKSLVPPISLNCTICKIFAFFIHRKTSSLQFKLILLNMWHICLFYTLKYFSLSPISIFSPKYSLCSIVCHKKKNRQPFNSSTARNTVNLMLECILHVGYGVNCKWDRPGQIIKLLSKVRANDQIIAP